MVAAPNLLDFSLDLKAYSSELISTPPKSASVPVSFFSRVVSPFTFKLPLPSIVSEPTTKFLMTKSEKDLISFVQVLWSFFLSTIILSMKPSSSFPNVTLKRHPKPRGFPLFPISPSKTISCGFPKSSSTLILNLDNSSSSLVHSNLNFGKSMS